VVHIHPPADDGWEANLYVRLVRWRAVAVDALVAVAAFAVSAQLLAASRPVAGDLRAPDAAAYVLLAVYSGSVVLRRRLPEVAVLAGLMAGLLFAAAQYPTALSPVVLLSVYWAGSVLPQRRSRLLLGVAALLGVIGTMTGPGPTDTGVPTVIVCAWLLGSFVGSRRAYTAELERKNALLEQAQAELAERAVAEERLRIARELHDVVAHSMSVVAVHAGTGRMVAEEDPAAARQALATIETASRSAMLEMRRLTGMLRSAGGDGPGGDGGDGTGGGLDGRAPAPGLGDLDALVADVVK
jgi:signal transduction histidine kinase